METGQYKGVSIISVSGMSSDRICYEGCDWLLEDRTVCGLGSMARRVGAVFNGEYGRRDRTGHQCRPVGQGRSMYGFIVNTTVGSYEAGAQLLGLSAVELIAINRGRGLPVEIEGRICRGVWQLVMEDTIGITNMKRLVEAQRETNLQEMINVEVKEEDDSDYVDTLNHLPISSCRIL